MEKKIVPTHKNGDFTPFTGSSYLNSLQTFENEESDRKHANLSGIFIKSFLSGSVNQFQNSNTWRVVLVFL